MVEDEAKLNEVLEYIESIKIRPIHPQITMEELDKNSMPLHEAMDKLRGKVRGTPRRGSTLGNVSTFSRKRLGVASRTAREV